MDHNMLEITRKRTSVIIIKPLSHGCVQLESNDKLLCIKKNKF